MTPEINMLPPIFQYLTKEVSLPGKEIRTTEILYWGGGRQVASAVDYDLLNITFYSDAKLELRKAFVSWIEKKIVNLNTWTFGYYRAYVGTIEIEVLNQELQPIYKVKVEEAFPKTISETSLSWENSDQPFEFTVGFQYFDWIPQEITT